MPLTARFQLGADRLYVRPESAIAVFQEALSAVGELPSVVNLLGVAGIGKSRLIRELEKNECGGARVVRLDLQVASMRQQEDALAALRGALGRQYVPFDRFDIAYAVLWQQLHPNLQLSSKELPFVKQSEILMGILDVTMNGVPFFGTAARILFALERSGGAVRRWRRIRHDDVLLALDDMSVTEMMDAVTYLFAEELKEASTERPFVLLVDAYESLVPSTLGTGRAPAADAWLRDLVGQLGRGLVVVAGREPLAWQSLERGWAEVITRVELGELGQSDRLRLLASGGITDPVEGGQIAAASTGLPFYLHLALDARSLNGTMRGPLVNHEQILERFLSQVPPAETSVLELLSPARVFGFKTFEALAKAFDIPVDRRLWDTLGAYSFIVTKEEDSWVMHALMRAALRRRLSPEREQAIARTLAGIWTERAEQGGPGRGLALRESTYYRLMAGNLDGWSLLLTADQAAVAGGRQAVDGIRRDLQNRTLDHPDQVGPDLREAASVLEIEAARLRGDAAEMHRVAIERAWQVDSPIGARGAIAEAGFQRVVGRTDKAIGLYRRVWQENRGTARLSAGAWLADLEICMGGFAQGIARAEQILADCPPQELMIMGKLESVLHDAYRWTYDYERGLPHYRRAVDCFALAGSVVEQAGMLTSRAETLAFADPVSAVDCAERALLANHSVGSRTSVGKAHLAKGIALTRLGRTTEAAQALDAAIEEFTRIDYQSGRARAQIFRACLHGRCREDGKARALAREGAMTLQQTRVYPTLIRLANLLMDWMGGPEGVVWRAAQDAALLICPLPDGPDLDLGTENLVSALLGWPVPRRDG